MPSCLDALMKQNSLRRAGQGVAHPRERIHRSGHCRQRRRETRQASHSHAPQGQHC
ncbi:hypothetical protein CSUI_009637 [Cystoisospora suis]|uniref:Uncharacterized protein n=1 Tax=Cystoisospora suis TaxID=483139 RepID=A0A2C6KHE9_9APIC|nr:hypothetical protein CSUI_009637 [Cystoisospora suis]